MNEKQPSTPQPDKNSGEYSAAEREPRRSPVIYVASLADYNNGVLHGTWIDAAREPEDIHAEINAMLASSREPGAEEWAIHDYDQFGRCRVGEHDSIERVARIAQRIAEHGYAFSAWVDLCDDAERFDDFADAYLGHYRSLQAYVDEMADDLGYTEELAKLPESLQPYLHFDTAALARDMELSGDIQTVEDPTGGVWIFQTNP
jgi:antirestriction protein